MHSRETKQANYKHVDSTALMLVSSVVSPPPPPPPGFSLSDTN